MGAVTTVGGKCRTIVARPDMSTNPTVLMSANDALGGLLTFTGAFDPGRRSGILNAVTIVDLAAQAAAMKLILYSLVVTGGTNNAAYDPADSEIAHVIGVVSIGTADYVTFTDNAVAHVSGLGIPLRAPEGTLSIASLASSSGLIQITTNTAHGLSTGNTVVVRGVGGVTAANGEWVVDVTSSTVFTLRGSTHAGTYTAGTGNIQTPGGDHPTAIYGQLVVTGAPTFAADGDITVKIHMLQD